MEETSRPGRETMDKKTRRSVNPYDDPDAVFIEESCGIVFLVEFVMGGVEWSVRMKQSIHGDKTLLDVVNATEMGTGRVLSGKDWEDLLAQSGLTADFYDAVVHEYLFRLGKGGKVAKA
jgi:hypothetical protein